MLHWTLGIEPTDYDDDVCRNVYVQIKNIRFISLSMHRRADNPLSHYLNLLLTTPSQYTFLQLISPEGTTGCPFGIMEIVISYF